jgi:hypothetical protein
MLGAERIRTAGEQVGLPTPDPLRVERDLGRNSLSFGRARGVLERLWAELRAHSEVVLKRQLWDGLLREAYGTAVGDDGLFSLPAPPWSWTSTSIPKAVRPVASISPPRSVRTPRVYRHLAQTLRAQLAERNSGDGHRAATQAHLFSENINHFTY